MEGQWLDSPWGLLMRQRLGGIALVLAVFATAAILPARVAVADPPVECTPDNPVCTVKVTDPGSPGQPVSDPTPAPGGGCTPPTGPDIPPGADCNGCVWQQLTPTAAQTLMYPAGTTFYEVLCYSPTAPAGSGPSSATVVVLPPGASPPGPGVLVATLGAQAVAKLPLPTVSMASAPGAAGRLFAETFVNFPTFFWLDNAQWRPLSATANDGFKSVTATATPESATFGMGDGHQLVCNGPGVPWHAGVESSYCSYTYAASSVHRPQVGSDVNDRPYIVTATVTYQVAWTCSGACGGQNTGTVGAVNGPTSRSPLVVGEIQTVVTG